MKNLFRLMTLALLVSCSKETTQTTTTPEPKKKFSITTSLSPSEGGSISPNGGQFTEGQSVSFTANPSEFFQFSNWSGLNEGSNNPITITILNDGTLTAVFEKMDSDGDGITDDIDQCPETPEGEDVNENGCSDSQIDTDNDGVTDNIDQCPNSIEGVTVNSSGCEIPLQIDSNGILKALPEAQVGERYEFGGKEYLVVDNQSLRNLIETGQDYSLAITTNVTLMTQLFWNFSSELKDISSWDTSNVISMAGLFGYPESQFQLPDISKWDVSSVTDFSAMFYGADLNDIDLSQWDTQNAETMKDMFKGTIVDMDLSNWNVSNVSNMSGTFDQSTVSSDISNWNTSNVTDMSYMFRLSDFNGDIGMWDVSNVESMNSMFLQSNFNSSLNDWDTASLQDVRSMFKGSSFNKPIDNWKMTKVNSLFEMFYDTPFNQDISEWDTSNVVDLSWTFIGSEFNQDINNWDVGKVEDFTNCFAVSQFDQPLSDWNIGEGIDEGDVLINMNNMFYRTSFNQDITNWDTSKVRYMNSMFEEAGRFNQDLSSWNVSSIDNNGCSRFSYLAVEWSLPKPDFQNCSLD